MNTGAGETLGGIAKETQHTMDKRKLQQKLVRITLTDADRLRIGKDLSEAIGRQRNTEMEFDDVKASYKAKLTAVEADVDRLSTTLSVGFEMRLENLWVRFLPKTGKKEFRLERQTEKDEPVLIEDMGPDDYALELIEAKSSATAGAAGANPEEKR